MLAHTELLQKKRNRLTSTLIYSEYKISYLYIAFKKIHFIHEIQQPHKVHQCKTLRILQYIEATVFRWIKI